MKEILALRRSIGDRYSAGVRQSCSVRFLLLSLCINVSPCHLVSITSQNAVGSGGGQGSRLVPGCGKVSFGTRRQHDRKMALSCQTSRKCSAHARRSAIMVHRIVAVLPGIWIATSTSLQPPFFMSSSTSYVIPVRYIDAVQ